MTGKFRLNYPKHIEKVVKKISTYHNRSTVYVCRLKEQKEEEIEDVSK